MKVTDVVQSKKVPDKEAEKQSGRTRMYYRIPSVLTIAIIQKSDQTLIDHVI